MIEFEAGERTAAGYMAIPGRGEGPGVLVLHAWWGLTPFFTGLCDRLAAEGFVALAPDLHHGRRASTIDEAEALLAALRPEEATADIEGAAAYLRAHPAVRGEALGIIGFSMGAAWATWLSAAHPAEVAAVVLFYGVGDADPAAPRAAYLGHFVEHDEWEPAEGVASLEGALRAAGREVTFHLYPGAAHWFFEADRPEYDPAAARLAWGRTVAFLRGHL